MGIQSAAAAKSGQSFKATSAGSENTSKTQTAMKTQLRGMDYASGAAMLKPEGGEEETYGMTEATISTSLENTSAHASYVDKACAVFGLSSSQVRAKIAVESTGNAKAGNASGANGLMQIKEATWNEVIASDGSAKNPKISETQPDWSGWTYTEANYQDPEKNIFVGCAALRIKSRGLEKLTSGTTFPAKDGKTMPAFDKDHPEFAVLSSLAYNLGQSTVAEAMKNAKSTMLDDVLKTENLDGPIRTYLWPSAKAKLPGTLKAEEVKAKEDAYVEKKLTEAYNYVGRNKVMQGRFEKLDEEKKKAEAEKAKKSGGTTAPQNTTKATEKKGAEPKKAEADAQAGTTHTVAAGETLYAISKKYGVTVEALRAANPKLAGNAVKAGDELHIPTGGSTATTAPKAKKEPRYHTLTAGQTYYGVAKLYGLTAEQLQTANNNKALKAGETVLIPE